MVFEVNNASAHSLGTAGLDTDEWLDQHMRFAMGKAKSPITVLCPYFLSDNPVDVRVTFLVPYTRSRIEVDDPVIGKKIKDHLDAFSPAMDEQEHKRLWEEINKILARDGASYDKLRFGEAVLTRRAIEALIDLCDKTVWYRKRNIHGLFTSRAVPKSERMSALRWLMKLLEAERDPDEQISVRIFELVVPEVAEDLIRLIQDPRQGEKRGPLCLALAKTKHSQAAQVIASVLGDKSLYARWALEALGKLKAKKYADAVRTFLKDPDADIRREAKKTLKIFGDSVDGPRRPVHLVKQGSAIPKALREWSANLDIAEVQPLLEKVAQRIDTGFGSQEIAEVIGVVEEMKVEQTRTLHFPIVTGKVKSEFWIVIFLDDVDSPDLEFYASPEIIEALG